MAQKNKGELLELLHDTNVEVLRAIIPQNFVDGYDIKKRAKKRSSRTKTPYDAGGMTTPDLGLPDGWHPKYIAVRQLKIFGGRRFSIEYTSMEEIPIPWTSEANLKDRIAKEYKKLERAKEDAIPNHDYDKYPGRKDATSLSLKVKEDTVVVLVLNEPKNVYFSKTGTPFSYNSADPDTKDRFYKAMRVNKKGIHKNAQQVAKRSRIAYMYVKPKQRTGGFEPDYDSAFNIHIDLIGLGEESKFRIPIIIDPDVRNPGGSGP